jgi:ATP-dependent DNA helicase DinG
MYNSPVPGLEAAVETLFGAGGALASVDARYEPRPQQAAMGLAVAQALSSGQGQTLVVEAGTGVGKSLGYLLPAALWAVDHGRRVLVSTYTRALQEQLLDKELPAAARALGALGRTLRYAMLQGADNYLCVQRLSKLRGQPGLFEEGGQGPLLDDLAAWARTAESGHRSGLPRVVPHSVWSKLSRDPDLCLGPNGRFWGQCLYRKDRERADRSHIVVVNHALLLSGGRLPPYDALIIDEAHALEEAAIGRFGVSVSAGRMHRSLEELRAASGRHPELEEPLKRCAEEFPGFLEETARAHGWPGREAEPGGALLAEAREALEPPALVTLESSVARALETRAAQADDPDEDEALSLRLAHAKLSALRNDLRYVLSGSEDDVARWVEWHPAGVAVHASPLDVGSRLGEGLLGRGVPVILTSATLDSGGGLRGFKKNLGLDGARELKLDSPFDYGTQAALLVQDDLPAPSDDAEYIKALAGRCQDIVDRVPGGVFILFSSWRALRAVHARLRGVIKNRPLWMQGDSGNDALLAEFAEAGNAVLLGVDTFWQGVDVPGEALSCVVLTKLPFPNFGSPVEEARRRWYESLGRGYFDGHSLPRAVMKFRQGFGRLIRSSTDRGAVVVLDPRLSKRGYGQAFLESLPRCRRLASLEELAQFFGAPAPKKDEEPA